MLASFPKAPSRFAQQAQSARAKERQEYVLDQMVEAGFITQIQRDEAAAQTLVFRSPKNDTFSGHALDYAVERAADLLEMIKGDSYFYVCGLKSMEEGVVLALRDIVQAAGLNWDEVGARLKAEGRLHLETY